MVKGMSTLDTAAYVLVAAGAINWGLVKFLNFNLVDQIATMVNMPLVGTLVYAAVGISGVYAIYSLFK